jgi:hypothetical protein
MSFKKRIEERLKKILILRLRGRPRKKVSDEKEVSPYFSHLSKPLTTL